MARQSSADFDQPPNPFAPQRTAPEIEVDKLRSAKRTARALASGGAVVGSISNRLQSQGLDPINAEQIATEAVIARSRVERLVGICIAAFGLFLVVIGCATSVFFGKRIFARRIPIYIGMAGLFFVMLGLAKAFHRSKRRRPLPGLERLQ